MLNKKPFNDSLFQAIKKGNIEEVRRLIQAGIDVNIQDSQGKTPLYWL